MARASRRRKSKTNLTQNQASRTTDVFQRADNLLDSTVNGRGEKSSIHSGNTSTVSFSPRNGLDPYARPYIPHALKFVNTLKGEIIATPPLRQIDFSAYVPTHVGSSFLPLVPQSSTRPTTQQHDLKSDTIFTEYESYFQDQITAEVNAQVRENEGYSLYEHDVPVSIRANFEATCKFVVPGLRENSPNLEEGDVVDLRQLVYPASWQDPRFPRVVHSRPGTPLALPSNYFGSKPPRQPTASWTGISFKARVTNIYRREEVLSLIFEGAKPHMLTMDPQNTVGGMVHCKFNIQFPITIERYLPMQHVLPVIQEALRWVKHKHNETDQKLTNGSSTPNHSWVRSMLFPTDPDGALQSKLNPGFFKRDYFDKELNWEQKKAVESVCVQDYGTVPFLISGPPGTGKTKTLVETALQLIHKVDKISHILFCAPSDPAADTLVQRLSKACKPSELLRLNRSSRTFAEVPDTVLPYCYILDTCFALPPFAQLMKYKIVVTTTRDASILMYARVSNSDLYSSEYNLLQALHPDDPPPSKARLHWTALLIDEAAQAIEPEALIPLSVVAPPLEATNIAFSPLFVMAGDEHQLGPRLANLSSPLKASLFARLFARPVYADHPLARGQTGAAPQVLSGTMLPIIRPPFANLIRNYRSHPAILSVPSNLFYADTLEHHATDTNRLASWDGWKGKRWPVLFHNSSGETEDQLEMDGGGWYNAIEAQIACRTALKLIQTGLVTQKEVCIMSPFKAQVKYLRNLIQKSEYGSLRNVDIGPTEIFQGLERGVVILCTTRTKARFVSKDQELGWGIIGTPNQMNVALTRAKFGLIVIGAAEVLAQDPNWQAFMSFCERNGLWEGRIHQGSGETERHNRLERILLADEAAEMKKRKDKALRVWNRGHGNRMGDEAMWLDGVQAEEDDMGSSDEEGTEEYEFDETYHHYTCSDEEETSLSLKNGPTKDEDDEEEHEFHESLVGLKVQMK